MSLRAGIADLVPSVERQPGVEGPHSQFGEDRILDQIFGSRSTGWCAEVGAYDGLVGSTTLLFETKGWDCLLVEPNPECFAAIRRNRSCAAEQCAASSEEGETTFFVADGAPQMSTLQDDPNHHRWIRDVGGSVSAITVRTARLDDLLDAAGFPELQFLMIDVEGHELEVLRGLTLERFRPRIVILEDNRGPDRASVARHMTNHGYVNFKRTGVNDWYAHRGDTELVQDAAVRRFRRARRRQLLEDPIIAFAVRHLPESLKRVLRRPSRRFGIR